MDTEQEELEEAKIPRFSKLSEDESNNKLNSLIAELEFKVPTIELDLIKNIELQSYLLLIMLIQMILCLKEVFHNFHWYAKE